MKNLDLPVQIYVSLNNYVNDYSIDINRASLIKYFISGFGMNISKEANSILNEIEKISSRKTYFHTTIKSEERYINESQRTLLLMLITGMLKNGIPIHLD